MSVISYKERSMQLIRESSEHIEEAIALMYSDNGRNGKIRETYITKLNKILLNLQDFVESYEES